MAMPIFSPNLPSVAPSPSDSLSKTQLSFRPNLSFRSSKKLQFHLLVGGDNGSGVAATATDEIPVTPKEPVGSNGSLTAAAPAEIVPAAEPVGKTGFQDPKWVSGTWDLTQFSKDGKTNWDAVIDAEAKRRKWMEDNPQSSSNDDPIVFETSMVPWWAWIKRYHLAEAELLNGRAAMVGFFMAYFVDSLTGVGLVDQMGNFFCKLLLFVAVGGVLLIRKNEDWEKLKKLVEEITLYDKQWQASWQEDETKSAVEK